ncbi:CHAP domain-containing protein [Staphylococcus arlettae]|nr:MULTISPECIES: CHAP domain-containing protein [Staphylococcus]MCG7337703.1 CHAP domain-containing protein [Staphylococcus sp. ACRSN]PTH25176.1 CHAP domain-containing protein [Staphylococcus arlettae]PTH34724.1 CHAP domain-containing protein [Staphylococcus arlettae]PTH45852.1 CHAP domain-containing protein [Staphylococcus arlettae]PTH55390.1 CHAP domain-containing protein [Staphylococcus arlettae]
MRKSITKGLALLVILGNLNVLATPNIKAQTYSTIEEAKKDHPEAQFNTKRSDGTFTYSYDETNNSNNTSSPKPNQAEQNSSINRNGQQSNNSNNSAYKENATSNSKIPNSVENNDTHLSQESNNSHNTQESPSNENGIQPESPALNTPSSEDNKKHSRDLSKAYKKDEHGMVTYIDTDALYDELQLETFNDKAQTVDGKPLALGNGKIIDKPAYTSKNNLYTSGQCTWYVFDKRAKDGETISTFWGDARNWAGQASASGFKVDHKPEVGSILQTVNGPYGHVAYVERVNLDGSIFISEMNWIAPYITSTRTISSSEVSSYNFIH